MDKLNERYTWALDVLAIKPRDEILEIGCGAGILAEEIAGRLSTGSLTLIDRSAPMIKKAAKRNHRFVESGHTRFITAEFRNIQPGFAVFDKVVAFNVNFFWKDAEQEMALIGQLLKARGKLYIFYQAPFDIDISAAEPLRKKLVNSYFIVEDLVYKKMQPASAFCIVAVKK